MKIHHVGHGAPRFVFLHGLFGQGRNWTSIAKKLAPHASVLVDLPDHGSSEWSDHFSYIDMADTVADLLAGLDQPVCLVGHSMGGRVAMTTAIRHPHLMDSLVVEDTSPADLDMSEFHVYADAMSAIPVAELTSRHQARASLRLAVDDDEVLGFLLQSLQPAAVGWRWIMNLEMLSRDMDEIGRWPMPVGTFDRPVLWITGTQSSRTSVEQRDAMKALFPLVRHVRVKDAGHWVHADAPEVFAHALRRFVDRL
ncbi:MAG: alpha/beta fold hydrolase [Propionibacteriaceae bacterium]|nr:alpha/beta fold hydrolase [Propionibacteriaceae bacterium]